MSRDIGWFIGFVKISFIFWTTCMVVRLYGKGCWVVSWIHQGNLQILVSLHSGEPARVGMLGGFLT